MKTIIVLLLKILGGTFIGLLLLLILAILAVSAVLIVVVLLQMLGVLKRVPLSYNLRNLRVRWMTTLLTATSFVVVVLLLTVMLAFVNGMFVLTAGSGIPSNVIVLAQGSVDEVFSDLGFGGIEHLPEQSFVQKGEVRVGDRVVTERLVSWELFLLANQPIPAAKPGDRQRRFIQIRGIEKPEVSAMVHNLSLNAGQWFSEAGVDSSKGGESLIQGALGEGIARELGKDSGKPSLQVGDEFELGPRRWIVVGIMKSAGTTFDSEVWGKRALLGDIFNKKTRTTAVVRTASAAEADKAAKYLKDEFSYQAVNARTEPEYYESLNGTNKQFLWAIGFIAVFLAIGGVVSVMITMFTAIAQRTKDIGILRILGYSRGQILVSFFVESLLLALLGGALGCAVGSICHGWTASSIIGSGQGGGKSVVLTLTISPWILGVGMSFALLMGCLGGLLPALSAIRVKLLDALR
jgi:ABC-type lipoprotein release transport system permease subunit